MWKRRNHKLYTLTNYAAFNFRYEDMKDPELRHFVDDILDMLKMTVYQSIHARSIGKPMKYEKLTCGKEVTKKYACAGEVLDKWLAKKNPATIRNFIENSGMRKFTSRSHFALSHMGTLNIASTKYIGAQINPKTSFSYINDKLMFNRFGAIFGIDDSKPRPESTPPASSAATLKLMMKRVKCLDETDPDWSGKDEISAGGVAIDDKKTESIIEEFKVGKFNSGDVVNFSPPKVLKSFVLDNNNPSLFTVFLALAEKDGDGFGDFLKELYESIEAELNAILMAVGKMAGQLIGMAIGGAVGTAIAGPLGYILGLLAGLILGALISWLSDLLQDDIFEPAITGINLERNEAFDGPVQQLTYRDFGASYIVDVYWTAS